jgi:undecaprenyl-diphosphatase
MTLLQTALLGLVQGATEFLPISSSGHLVLIPWLFNWREPGLSFTAIIHWGTLAAVLAVFWRDLARILSAVLESLKTRSLTNPEARIGVWILLGTIPTVSIGYIFEEDFNHFFRNPSVVAGFLLLTSIILLLGERQAVQNHSTDEMRWYDALLIGLAQAVAIMPGISRSGITISVGLLLGLQRT